MQRIKRMVPLLALAALMASCGGNSPEKGVTVREMDQQVKAVEDSLKRGLIKPDPAVEARYAESCLKIYRTFPNSKEAPRYLDKAHMIYSSAGSHEIAARYADTLIRKYPKYENRPMVLLSLASAYDMFIVPRNKFLVEKYYRLLLTENPNLPKEEREGYEFRLKHIDLTYEELIDLQAQKAVNQ